MIEQQKIPVVGYCRFSSSNQREESISAQKRFILAYANQNKMEVIDWYVDEAKSGKTANRPAFLKLIEDIEKKPQFKAVLVHKLDRLSRSVEDTLHFKGMIEDHNIQVVSVCEQFDTTPAGRLMVTMMSGINEYYIRNLGAEVMKGMVENALKGLWTGGKPPLGYDLVEGKLVINPKEAEAIKLIFKLTCEGKGYGQIIDELNIRGYKTKRGQCFGKNSLYEIIKNERYKGVYIFNRRSSSTSQNKRNNHAYKNDEDIIRIEGGCPAIVSTAVWDRANAIRSATRSSYTNAQHSYLLTGLLYCECGGKFHGNIRRHKQKGLEYTTYRCSERVNKHSCSVIEIRTDILDAWVIEQFFNCFFNDESVRYITKLLNEQLQQQVNEDEEYLRVKEHLKTLEKGREHLIDAIIQTGSNEAVVKKLEEYERLIASSKAFLANHDKEQLACTVTEAMVRKQLEDLKDYLQHPDNLEKSKFILSQYIERIDISNDSIKATFKVAFPLSGDGFITVSLHPVSVQRRQLLKEYRANKHSEALRIVHNLCAVRFENEWRVAS